MSNNNYYSRKSNHTPYNLVFDWGNTLMQADLPYKGPMVKWEEVYAVSDINKGLSKLTKYHKFVATNAGESNAEQVKQALGRVNLENYFENIFTSRDLNFEKPQPGFFGEIEKALGQEAETLVMIGDSFQTDILGARQAGWKTLWYNPDSRPCPGLMAVHNGEIYEMAKLDEALNDLNLPDWDTCLNWQIEFNFSNNIWMHSQAVAGTAYLLALWLRQNGEEVNPILAHRGGLLHDLAKLHPQAGSRGSNDHGVLAGKILYERGQPALAEIAIRHMLFGLEVTERQPKTWEEILVYFADKLIEGKNIVSIDERLAALNKRYQSDFTSFRGILMEVQDNICKHIRRCPQKMLQDLKDYFYKNQG